MLISSLPTSSDTERKTLVKSSRSNQYIRVPTSIGRTTTETALRSYACFWVGFKILIENFLSFFFCVTSLHFNIVAADCYCDNGRESSHIMAENGELQNPSMSQMVMEHLLLNRLLRYVLLNHLHEFNSYLTTDTLVD